jgi:hypothetical protein
MERQGKYLSLRRMTEFVGVILYITYLGTSWFAEVSY